MSGITQDWRHWCSSLVVGGVLIASLQERVFAQITPDNTLPNNSIVTPDGSTLNITGGTQAGSNLFHSFEEFSVRNGGTAIFNNALDIQNIISRVTGGSVSNIDGLIRANGTANLFLINPNGIIFGQNASLNIGGSFVGTTANALEFGNRGFFSATEKNIPSPLLTINPSALLFNQINQNAVIQNTSVAFAGTDLAGFNAFGLRVPDGKSLLLVGGNISMDGGQLNANGGRVELGGLAEPGTVALGVDGDNLRLIFPENVGRTEVSLANQTGIYVDGVGGGNIAVNARNLEILGESALIAGIGQGLGTPETIGGDITLNATGSIKVAGGSIVGNFTRLESQGSGGNINIDSGSFSLQDGARLAASTFGQGNAGNVRVSAKHAVSLADAAILSTVESGSVGKGGNIDINAATLSLIDGAQLASITRRASATQPAGRGDAGDVNINITGLVNIAGEKNGFLSGILSSAGTGTVGNGGNITIDSGSFLLQDGARLAASTFGQGNAGNVRVSAKHAVSLADAFIFSTVESGSVGKGGNIDINAATLSLIDGAQLASITRRASSTQPAGRGDAGDVNINITGLVNIAGEKNGFVSGISSTVELGSVGKGGNIDINAATLSLIDGAQVATSALGVGNAGTIAINADVIALDGAKSGVFNTLGSTSAPIIKVIINDFGYPQVTIEPREQTINPNAQGNSGNIDITSKLFSITNGARLAASTFGRGNAGSINLNTQNAVFSGTDISGLSSGVFSAVEKEAVGNAGTIKMTTNELTLKRGAQLVASSFGEGNAGTVTIEASDKFLVNGANSNGSPTGVFAESRTGRGGDIGLQIKNLLMLRHQGLISATSGVAGSAGLDGNINIGTKFLVAVPSENSDIVATGFGRSPGSNIQVNAQGIFGTQFRQQLSPESDIVATGQVTLNTPDVEPNSGLVNLPTVPVDTEVAQTCQSGGTLAKSSFTITGRGGLPPNPGDALNTDAVQVDLITLNPSTREGKSPPVTIKPTTATPKTIVEATGWVMNAKGELELTANAPSTPHGSWQNPVSCRAS